MHTTANKVNSKKYGSWLLLASGMLAAVFFLVLFSSVRCEPDDMIISLECRNSSLLQVLWHRYTCYSFRPLYTLGAYLSIGYSQNSQVYPLSIFIFYSLLYLLFIFSIYKLFIEIFSLSFRNAFQKVVLLALSNLFLFSLYFMCSERIEIFAWVSASLIHLLPVVLLFFSAWLIIKKKQRKIDFFLLAITAVLVAGGAEHISAACLAVLLLTLPLLFYSHRKDKTYYQRHKIQWQRAVFFLCFLGLSFAVCITNPGLRLHLKEVHDAQSGFAVTHAIHPSDILGLMLKPYKVLGLFFLILTWVLFTQLFEFYKQPRIKISYFILALGLVLMVSIGSGIFAYHTLSVGRIWFLWDICLVWVISAWLLNSTFLTKTAPVALPIAGWGFFIGLLFFDVRHVPALLHFASAHDRLILDLQKKASGETVVLHDFPKPDLCNQVEPDSDPEKDVNRLFCRFYNIQAKVSLKK